MDIVKKFKKRLFIVIGVSILLMGAAASCAGYYGLNRFFSLGSTEAVQAFFNRFIPEWVVILKSGYVNYYTWIVPAIIGIFLLAGGLWWLILTAFVSPVLMSEAVEPEPGNVKKKSKNDFIDNKIEQERKRRLFLHTLSVLQREGRLLDFFDEDLSVYEDGQIGAAVRSIQEDCKKAVKKYIDPKPVVEGEEGDTITIEDGFDIDAINLVGNVSGQPPFQGIIKHPGWKAGKKDVPKLSDIQDPGIMTPAEIEIQ